MNTNKQYTQTKGERRVRTNFNVTANSNVDTIKQNCVSWIDFCDDRMYAASNKARSSQDREEAMRLWNKAQELYEEAAMWAVKAETLDIAQIPEIPERRENIGFENLLTREIEERYPDYFKQVKKEMVDKIRKDGQKETKNILLNYNEGGWPGLKDTIEALAALKYVESVEESEFGKEKKEEHKRINSYATLIASVTPKDRFNMMDIGLNPINPEHIITYRNGDYRMNVDENIDYIKTVVGEDFERNLGHRNHIDIDIERLIDENTSSVPLEIVEREMRREIVEGTNPEHHHAIEPEFDPIITDVLTRLGIAFCVEGNADFKKYITEKIKMYYFVIYRDDNHNDVNVEAFYKGTSVGIGRTKNLQQTIEYYVKP